MMPQAQGAGRNDRKESEERRDGHWTRVSGKAEDAKFASAKQTLRITEATLAMILEFTMM
jgi:hypothetical protein